MGRMTIDPDFNEEEAMGFTGYPPEDYPEPHDNPCAVCGLPEGDHPPYTVGVVDHWYDDGNNKEGEKDE